MTVKEFFEGDKRMVALTLMALISALAFSVYFVEGAYSGADSKKAVKLVQEYQIGPTSDEQISKFLLLKYPGAHRWSAEVISSCHGYVRVTAKVPTPAGVVDYKWDVDLVKNGIHPANPAGRSVLGELETLRAALRNQAAAKKTAPSPVKNGAPKGPTGEKAKPHRGARAAAPGASAASAARP